MSVINIASVPFLAVGVIILTAAYRLFSAVTSPLRSVPGPWYSHVTSIVLKWHILAGRRIHFVHSLHLKYGPVVLVSPDEVAISDLEAFSQIHKIGSGFTKSNWYDKLRSGREPGIFFMRDPHQHAARRRLFARAFSNNSLLTHWDPEIRQKTQLAVANIKNDAQNGSADILKWWTLMATDVIAHLSFGESFRMLELGKQTPYIDAIQAALLCGVARNELSWIFPILRHLPFKGIRDIVNADNVVFEHGAKAVQNMSSASDGLSTANLFSQMLAQAQGQEKTEIKDSTVRTEAGNLIVAGSDTTAITLTYLVWAVLSQPRLQAALELEVCGLSPSLTFDELKSAPLLNSVIEETLRLYGAAPGALPRVVPGKGLSVRGYFIPAGTVVSTQAYTLHRDSTVFPDAHRFDGERFMDKSRLTAAQKTAMSPFGAGSRICIGLHLAWMELRLATALFFRECRGAKLDPGMTDDMMEMDNRFLIAPKGHCCKIQL
ncbi:hypothetical protein NCS57_00516200 [Fusarium keratoplasticum]|uniref:Uncharacterized protein n=1 Tax=Fusarium keratoplasticum TaxID=1328300 RepID=A0ACC0QZP0_9HYPO|nr:hypothetical protein NCS57_00516200 [Fusarium keratoplasticum]KAI8670449.1 hypothetical protein NCS57_00516200 [Fusarium keratoplasticum]KAI8677685.1 hypothetical protein NCS55_00485900 [Fusarium keratoplasticum]